MKKYLLTTIFACFAFLASAQRTQHALGFHFGGSTMDLEYQYHYNNKNFFDVSAGIFDLGDGFLLQGVYNWNIQRWSDWTPRFATWKLWGGAGAGLGYVNEDHAEGMMIGPVGNIGFGFTLKAAPITIGVDYRPMLAFAIGNDSGVVGKGFANLGLTMTYRF